MNDDASIPKAISESEIMIFGKRLRCYVLDNGERIINADDVEAFFPTWGTCQAA